jgi:hypothetical protein
MCQIASRALLEKLIVAQLVRKCRFCHRTRRFWSIQYTTWYCHDVWVTVDGVLDWMIGFIARYTFTARDYRQLQRYRWSTYFTVHRYARTRILSLHKSYPGNGCDFKSHMKSSFHGLTPFLPLFCSCQFRILGWVQFINPQAHIPAGWRPETRLFTSPLFYSALCLQRLLYNHFSRTTQNTQPLLLRFYNHFSRTTQKTASIVKQACLLIRCLVINVLLLRALAPAGMCLPSRCLAMDLYVTIHTNNFSN